jgi:hypothetical protein
MYWKGQAMAKGLKIGVRVGAGPEPGYEWNVWILDLAYKEAMKFLDEDQYAHLSQQMRELARDQDPTHSAILSVDAVRDFFELREKGGPLGKINVRVFFFPDTREQKPGPANHAIVVLGAIKKENEGRTPPGDIIRIQRRLRKYLEGDYGRSPI